MFAFFGGASYKIARNLIQVTGLKESLAVFQQNNFSNIGETEVLKLLLAVDACNLLQTMKEETISREIGEEDLQDTVEDYVVENLKTQALIPCRDGAERMDQCQEILGIAAKFQEYWHRDDTKDPGPRFYCVKELLRRLNCEANTPIHDNLFEFVYEQHNRFNRYFRTLLEPFREEESPEDSSEPQPSAVAIHSPPPEPTPVLPLDPPPVEMEKEAKKIPVEEKSTPVPEVKAPPPAAAPVKTESGAPSSPRNPPYRKLDMMDTLSGFPNREPWPRKEKAVESAKEISPAEKNPDPFTALPSDPLTVLLGQDEIPLENKPEASADLPPGPDPVEMEPQKTPVEEKSPAVPDPLASFPDLGPLPGEEDAETETTATVETPAREAELEAGEIPLWEDFTAAKNLSVSLAPEASEKSGLGPAPKVEEGSAGPPPAREIGLETVGAFGSGDFSLDENLAPPGDEPGGLEGLSTDPPQDFSKGATLKIPKPTPQMLEDLFDNVNPIDPGRQKKREDQA